MSKNFFSLLLLLHLLLLLLSSFNRFPQSCNVSNQCTFTHSHSEDYNLQSYPSADSLDRVYSVESAYSNYYANLGPMHSHYGHRAYDQNRTSAENAFVGSSSYGLDHYPPRPASSAHVMFPPQPNQPPPYSRVAVSPPPAYKMPSSAYGYGSAKPNVEHQFHPIHSFAAPLEFDPLQTTEPYFHSRKVYHPSSMHQSHSIYRSYSPPFEPYANSSNDHFYIRQHSLARPTDPIGSYRNLPLSYATTSRNHVRSSHFHQLGSELPLRQQLFDPRSIAPSIDSSVLPYAVGRSYTHRHHHHHHKKKKKHSSKSRSSSTKGSHPNHNDDEDDDENENDYDDDDDDPSVEMSLENNRKVLSRLRKRRSEEKSKRRKDRIVPHDDEKSGNIVTLETNKDGANKIKTESTKKTLEEHEDSDSEVVDYDGTIEPEEDEDETVSSNNSGIISIDI